MQKVGVFYWTAASKHLRFTYVYFGTLLPGLGDLLYEMSFCFGLGGFFALSMSDLRMNAVYYNQLEHIK